MAVGRGAGGAAWLEEAYYLGKGVCHFELASLTFVDGDVTSQLQLKQVCLPVVIFTHVDSLSLLSL